MANEPQQLGFDLTTRIDTGDSFVKAQQDLANLNQEALDLAKSLSRVESVMDDMKSGTISASKTLQVLKDGYAELSVVASQFAKKGNLTEDEQQLFKAVQKKMAVTKQSIESTQSYIAKMRKAGLSEEVAIGRLSVNETKRQNDEKLKIEREASKQMQQIWQNELKQYQNIQAQKNAKSSLKDFSTKGTGLKLNESLFNTTIAVTGVRQLSGAVQNLGHDIVDIQYNLQNTQRIMHDFSKETRDSLLENAAETARLTNTQITDVQNIQGAWVRINDTYADNLNLLSDITTLTSKFMNVGEIEDAETAVNLLNASLLQFGHTGEDALKYAEEFTNKWAYMADITAMGTADEYGEAISKYGAVVKQLNGDMDESIALASIMADRLAKNGAEAGTALKTFTTYMNRSKTIDLFNQISVDLGDTSYQLADANGQLKDFDENLRLIAKAYKEYSESGNDVMANKVLEAVGATRQRDSAMAIINAVNEGDYDKYMQELQSGASDNYLNEQNAALMDTLSASLNAMMESFKELGMVIGNSGVITWFTYFTDGLTGLLKIVSDIPQPIMTMVSAIAGLKVATTAGKYIGELTGLTQKYHSLIQQGTSVEIQNANTISASANAYMKRMEFMGQNKKLTKDEIELLFNQKTALDDLTTAYNNGEINATQYSQAVTNLIGQEQLSANAKAQSADELIKQTSAQGKHIALTKAEKDSLNKETLAEKSNTNAKEKNWRAKLKDATQSKVNILNNNLATLAEIKNTAATKFSTVAQEANTFAKTKGALAAGKSAIQNGLLSASFNVLGAAAGVAATGINALVATIAPWLTVITLIATGISFIGNLFGGIFDGADDDIKEAANTLEDLESELDEVKSKIEELEKLRGSTTNDTMYDDELQYWKDRKQAIEENIEAQKLLVAYNTLFKDDDENENDNLYKQSKEDLKDLTEATKEYAKAQDMLTMAMNNGGRESGYDVEGYEEKVASARRSILETKTVLEEERHSMQQYYNTLKADFEASGEQSVITESQLANVKARIDEINDALSELPQGQNMISFDMNDSLETINKLQEEIDKVQSDMDGLFESMNDIGNIDVSNIDNLINSYADFYTVADKPTQDQILFLKNYQLDLENKKIQEINDGIESLMKQKQEIFDRLENNKSGKITMDSSEVNEAQKELDSVNKQLDELQSRGSVYLSARLELPDLSDTTSAMDSLLSATKDLVSAQEQLASGAALSKQELYKLAMTYPELLYQANLFNDASVDGQQKAISAVMDMYEQQFDSQIDIKIAELEAQKEFIQGVLDLEQQKLTIVNQAEVDAANGRLDTEAQVQEMLGQYNDAIGEQYTLAEQYKVDKTVESGQARIETENQTGKATTDVANEAGWSLAEAITNGSAAGIDGLNINTNKASTIIGKLVDWAWGAAKSIAGMFSGKKEGSKPNGSGNVGDKTNTFDKAQYDSVSNTIDGKTITQWVKTQQDALKKNIKQYELQLGQINTAIGNLNKFKDMDFDKLSNNYNNSDKGGSGNKGSGSSKADKEAKEAQKAAENAAKASKEAAEAIERLTESYVKNVEDLQKRIANALKKKYQEQYDERKKLLEKEHNERVEQIQKEIDAINGERPQDKQSELERLQSKLAQWQNDDSTLGKQKQKEYLDQIAELEKEIKLDELEDKLDKENETYENSIDKDSEFYDKILAKLDKQMSDEMIYREANDLIRNGKIDEIVTLLTKYDAQWDGWATLMGKTAGEIIAEEVKLAIANYLDVIQGTITPDGGYHTNKVTGGGSTTKPSGGGSSSSSGGSSSSSGGSSSGTISKGRKVKIKDTSAGMYVSYDSGRAVDNWKGWNGTYYVVNTKGSRVALGRTSSVASAIGWIDKTKVVGLNTGGYTGNNQGLAMLHKKERVLNADQTAAFEKLIYDFLPNLDDKLLTGTSGNVDNSTNVTFNKELVQVNINKVVQNKEFDQQNGIDNLDRMLRNSLKKSGVRLKR